MISLTTVLVFACSLLVLAYGGSILWRTRDDGVFESEVPTIIGSLLALIGGIGTLIAAVAGLQELYESGFTEAPWLGGLLVLGGLVFGVERTLRNR